MRPSHPDDPALTRLLFPHPPARPAAIVARAVGLHRAHAHGLLEGLDFHVAAGELVAVLGGAHAGKSALIWALAGLDHAGEGLVDVAERRAVILQNPCLVAWKRVVANVTYGPRTSGGRAAAYRALERVGARQYTHAWPAELTRETTIRVLLARAIVRDPALVLLDEPLAGLSTEASASIQQLLRDLSRELGLSIVITTDSVSDAISVADRIVVLNEGRATLELDVDADARTPRGAEFDRLRVVLASASAGVKTLTA